MQERSDNVERIALPGVPPERMPRHIAIIMDGNGRWARRRGLPRVEGHRNGAESVRRVSERCAKLGVEQLTLYCFSSENWRRPVEERNFLMELLRQFMIEERASVMEANLRISVIGRREGLPDNVLAEIDKTVEMSSANTGMRLCLAINYGARAELADAAKALAEDVQKGRIAVDQIDEDALERRLYTAGMPDPDLLIRTAGEMRISNFLLWQISYAEIWVADVCWPDFHEDAVDRAIQDYAARERRFGGLNQ